eukprot:Skav236675  [mRNA]  locus=scaffold338:499372:499596:- [translate_table: standard]
MTSEPSPHDHPTMTSIQPRLTGGLIQPVDLHGLPWLNRRPGAPAPPRRQGLNPEEQKAIRRRLRLRLGALSSTK